jgi:transcription elongation factor Elf1
MKENIMISLRHPGRCSVCGKEIEVITLGNVKTKKVAYVCEDCSKKLKMKTSKFVENYGKEDDEPFKPGIRILPGTKDTKKK